MMADVLFWLTMGLLICAMLIACRGIALCNEVEAIDRRLQMFERLEVMKRIDEEEKERYSKRV